jgi:hypothetical protein
MKANFWHLAWLSLTPEASQFILSNCGLRASLFNEEQACCFILENGTAIWGAHLFSVDLQRSQTLLEPLLQSPRNISAHR